jgi:hypothetical protein
MLFIMALSGARPHLLLVNKNGFDRGDEFFLLKTRFAANEGTKMAVKNDCYFFTAIFYIQ